MSADDDISKDMIYIDTLDDEYKKRLVTATKEITAMVEHVYIAQAAASLPLQVEPPLQLTQQDSDRQLLFFAVFRWWLLAFMVVCFVFFTSAPPDPYTVRAVNKDMERQRELAELKNLTDSQRIERIRAAKEAEKSMATSSK